MPCDSPVPMTMLIVVQCCQCAVQDALSAISAAWSRVEHFDNNEHSHGHRAVVQTYRLVIPAAWSNRYDKPVCLYDSTVSMTVLAVAEMFNALNALSENASLLSLLP